MFAGFVAQTPPLLVLLVVPLLLLDAVVPPEHTCCRYDRIRGSLAVNGLFTHCLSPTQ